MHRYCTVGCVHRVAQVDELRQDPQTVLAQWFPAAPGEPNDCACSHQVSQWVFVTNPYHDLFLNAAARLFGAGHRG